MDEYHLLTNKRGYGSYSWMKEETVLILYCGQLTGKE